MSWLVQVGPLKLGPNALHQALTRHAHHCLMAPFRATPSEPHLLRVRCGIPEVNTHPKTAIHPMIISVYDATLCST